MSSNKPQQSLETLETLQTPGAMEFLGYDHRRCTNPDIPPEEEVAAVERTFEQSQKIETSYFRFCKGGPECEAFLRSGADIEKFVESVFGVDFIRVKKQKPSIVEFKDRDEDEHGSPWMTAHPSHDAISVFRPLRSSINSSNGLFKLVGMSHGQTTDEFLNEAKDSHETSVEPRELLVLRGGLWVQPSNVGGGRMVWQGFSRRPMGTDIFSPHAMEFMKM